MHKTHEGLKHGSERWRLLRQVREFREIALSDISRDQALKWLYISAYFGYFSMTKPPDSRLICPEMFADLTVVKPALFEKDFDALLINASGHGGVYAIFCIERKESDSCNSFGLALATALIVSFSLTPTNLFLTACLGGAPRNP